MHFLSLGCGHALGVAWNGLAGASSPLSADDLLISPPEDGDPVVGAPSGFRQLLLLQAYRPPSAPISSGPRASLLFVSLIFLPWLLLTGMLGGRSPSQVGFL